MRRLGNRFVLSLTVAGSSSRWHSDKPSSQNKSAASVESPSASSAASIAEEVATPPTGHNNASTDESTSTSPLSVPSTEATSSSSSLQTPEVEPERWVQKPYEDPALQPIQDEKGEYIVSAGNWPTGEVAYRTPPPPDKLAPRFGYNILQVKKDVTWWQHYHKYPRLSVSYINIHFWFIIGAAWLGAFLTEEYRRTTDEMKTPGAMVGEHRGRGPSTKQTQKVTFTPEEMNALVNTAQTNWVDGKGEQSFIGSKDYRMKQIARPKEFSLDDVRKR